MKLIFTYGTDTVVLPAAVGEHIGKAGKKDIRVLFALASDPMARIDLDAAVGRVAAALSLSEGEVQAALGFWRGTGILSTAEEGEQASGAVSPAEAVSKAPAVQPKVIADKGLPAYSTEELSGVLERRAGLAALVDACQQTFGKIFNTAEVGVIAGLTDYLGLDGEYILLLLSHCVRMGKTTLRYVEKTALSLHDEGVTDAKDLAERLHGIEQMADGKARIRKLFGISSRALTTKEKRYIEKWICEMQWDDDVLKLAYEITVDTIHEPSMAYTNSILERWYAEGYRGLEDVQRAIAEYKRQKTNQKGSFDVNDFFEAALRRSYEGT